jgi:hypothetical protein
MPIIRAGLPERQKVAAGSFGRRKTRAHRYSASVKKKTQADIERHAQRLLIREALRKFLSVERMAQLAGAAGANAVPGANIVADAAIVAEIAAMAADFIELKRDTEAAIEFIQNGPYKLEDLLVDREERTFSSYAALIKTDLAKVYGRAGDGWAYHHIVEQAQEGETSASQINSTHNVVRIPRMLHEMINSQYATKDYETTQSTLRDWLRGKPFATQWDEGVRVLRKIGAIQ